MDFSSRPSAAGVAVPVPDVATSYDSVTVFNDGSPAQVDGGPDRIEAVRPGVEPCRSRL